MSDNRVQGPLAGIRVLDFTHVLSGPFATVLLADLGADVVKVERPSRGDTTRGTPPYLHGISHYFVAVNHSKRGIGVDMQHAQGCELLLRLAAEADVVINNFRPGVLDEHGLSAETLSARNPRLIQCSISGFGQSGSYAQRASFDLITQAMTGVMSVTGEVGGPPLRCGLSIGDMVAGLYAVQAITTALYERERTGRGQVLDVSMFDCLFSFLSYYVTLPQATGKPPEPAGSMHASVVPMSAFRTQDGHIAIAAFNQRFWRGLCAAVGRPDLADDPRYASLRERQRHRDALMAELTKVRRVISRQLEGAPHETLLTLDATTGQNGLRQASVFAEAVALTGVVLTKLDGTARGGIALAIARELQLPVKLIGIGEALEDLRPFDAEQFARALIAPEVA